MNEAPPSSRVSDVVIVSGLSGAGRSTALHALEDLNYYCIDNLPPVVVEETVRHCQTGGITQIAFGLDTRAGAFLTTTTAAIERLKASWNSRLRIVFLDASDDALLRRFSSTRRPHPLSTKRKEAVAVLDGIRMERERLAPMRAIATEIIDTTQLSIHELRRRVIDIFSNDKSLRPRMLVRVVSFGFKYGAPVDADLLFDVRFIDNPYFDDELRPLSGHDPMVKDYVFKHQAAGEFLNRVGELLQFLLPHYQREGKSYLTVAIGCTGGRHRSVVLVDALAETVRANSPYRLEVQHRDIDREARLSMPP